MSVDIEAIMYEHARKVGITLFTVSHRYIKILPPPFFLCSDLNLTFLYRTSLIRHHEYLLRFDGEGHYEFRE